MAVTWLNRKANHRVSNKASLLISSLEVLTYFSPLKKNIAKVRFFENMAKNFHRRPTSAFMVYMVFG